MEKRKLLSVVLFCLCFVGIALAEEVINVDLNAEGDDVAYTGEGAIAGETVWRAIYSGIGVAVGSERTANLANYDDPNKPSIYAAQVWLDIPEGDLFDKVDDGTTGNELMDDGFEKSGTKDPCMSILGEPEDAELEAGAYNGTYDIYVYCSLPTTVTLKSPAIGSSSDSVAVAYAGGAITAANYVVFDDVVIDDGEVGVAGDANTVTIVWNNIINGITLVKQKPILEIDNSYSDSENAMYLLPTEYDEAKETNARVGEGQPFGPDNGIASNVEPNYSGPALFYLDASEYMIYDFHCSDSNAGKYYIEADIIPVGENDASLLIYYYNGVTEQEIEIGQLTYTNLGGVEGRLQPTDTPLEFNIFAGEGYIKWLLGPQRFFNLVDLRLYYSDELDMQTCDDVYFYKYNYASDYAKNCKVDYDDLYRITSNWVQCYDPDTENCP
jgi:hypothetical protein